MKPGYGVIDGTARDVIAKLTQVAPDAPVRAVIGQSVVPVPATDLAPATTNDAETRALAAAVAVSDTDPRTVSHDEARAWLVRLASGEFDAPPPEPG